MARGIFIFMAVFVAVTAADAASVRGVSTASRTGKATAANQIANPTSSYTYNYMYPYLNNQMKTTLKPADPTSPTTSPINAVVRTEQLSTPRRVVARSAKKTTGVTTVARRVVPRSAVSRTTRPTNIDNHKNGIDDNYAHAGNSTEYSTLDGYRPTGSRGDTADRDNVTNTDAQRGKLTSEQRSAATLTTYGQPNVLSSSRCLADYTECMDRYCVRDETLYNRCFCSAKLAQIDATYQPAIESLVTQILALKNGSADWSDEEFNAYWMEKIGQYTGDNSWQNIDTALLSIDWSTMENRTRGQNAFVTGHDYCVQHLQGCFYMASNLHDAYRSKINTDCATYETSLQRLKNAAESVIEAYKE